MVPIVDASSSPPPRSKEKGLSLDRWEVEDWGQLAYDGGMRVLTASQADNVALESNLLQQGRSPMRSFMMGWKRIKPTTNRGIILLRCLSGSGTESNGFRPCMKRSRPDKSRALRGGREAEGWWCCMPDRTDNSLKKSPALQQPALFDFTKHTQATVLVREPENLKATESNSKD